MEVSADAAAQASQLVGMSFSPESLRRRQRDRLSPRGRFVKTNRNSIPAREVEVSPNTNEVTLSAAPRSKTIGKPSTDSAKTRQMQEGLRKGDSVTRRAKRAAEDAKHDITPDGGSASREGRQFTVANVGNNGRIYLRPTIRPANQRYPQPSFTFPVTPPSTAGLDALASRNEDEEAQRDSLWTPTRSPSTPYKPVEDFPTLKAPERSHHRRAFSHSTTDEQHVPVYDSDVGAFKVIIERPGTSKTMEPFEGIPILEVPIPSYKLGTPRFSTRGTAFLRSSSYTTSEDVRSSVLSLSRDPSRDPTARRFTRGMSRRHSDASTPRFQAAISNPATPIDSSSISAPSVTRQRKPIVPEMFDALTFKPACDHPSVVRYSSGGAIKAATPERLVAEITSPTFVDYDLLSDFFLTFRTFLETTDLLHMLIARLKWAVARGDETGTVVRVRTFVALRHWILNYFLDDYVVDYDLRKAFCELLNGFISELEHDAKDQKAPLKILEELKKCWRRVCALYWDGDAFDLELGQKMPICPGGVAGSRNPDLDPSFWEQHPDGPPRLDGIIEPDFVEHEVTTTEGNQFFADVSRAGHIDSILASPHLIRRPTDAQDPDELKRPSSIMSDDFVSCSFPSCAKTGGPTHPLGVHPVAASSINGTSPIATTPKALTGKRVRPVHAHKRSASFSDSIRDHRPQLPQQPVQKVIYKSTELLLTLPYAGSLVRGNLFPPGQAFVEEMAPSTPAELDRATTLFTRSPANQKGPSAMSGPGMKKLLGSVRRALRNKNDSSPNSSPTQGSFPHIPPLGVRGATINRLPGTAIVPQARPRNTGLRAPMRIDLLSAEVAEDFKRAVREDAEADAEKRGASQQESVRSKDPDPSLQFSEMHADPPFESTKPAYQGAGTSDLANSSKDLVIVDDTLLEEPLPSHSQMMTGALPANSSVEDFTDTFMHPSGGPTPPKTPPDAPLGTPRRSSHLLGQHARNRTLSLEGTPSLEVDSRFSHEDERSPSHRPVARHGRHSRHRVDSFRGKRSVSLRRYASYHSSFTREKSERSFDASTFSDPEQPDRLSSVPSIPLPLRVLRRRPGGDLKAVTNVGDLNGHPLRRPMSMGSITTYSESVRSSYLLGSGDDSRYVDVVNSDYDESQANYQTFSLGALAEAAPKAHVSLFSTHSSQPVMRPSFEKEAQMLAQIPDDIDDDGGVESALLKLEGKFEQRRSEISASSTSHDMTNIANTHSFGHPQPFDVSTLTLDEDEEEKRRHRHGHILDHTPQVAMGGSYKPPQHSIGTQLMPTVYQPKGMIESRAPRSFESYNSSSLLQGSISDDGKFDRRQSRDWSHRSVLREHSDEGLYQAKDTPQSSHPNSFDFIDETESLKRIPRGATRPSNESAVQSFLEDETDDDDDGRSDLSSEMSLEVISRIECTEHDSTASPKFPPIRPGTVIKEMALPSHPLRHPPSPPMTLTQALLMSPNSANTDDDHTFESGKLFPLSPETTPIALIAKEGFGAPRRPLPSVDPLRSHGIEEPSRKTSVHLPFTLAFDSQILAQQFTLIEKDALNEIDWKDLIEMRWKDASTDSRSWVEFLRTSEPRGVEVVIARFNLMVKWTVSEIVLTQDLEERVRCIIKYIHIAAHCRKYRNFATMTQLAIALTSKDISRLTQTWDYVPASDKQTLKDLEALVSPTSNFYNIRAEMEGRGADQGCIPFVGIYTHDLLINYERPSQIASTPSTEPLVNFERSRTDATIVKNLLRLLEASQLYRFLPIEGITERCLWMAALSDDEIAKYGKMIQA